MPRILKSSGALLGLAGYLWFAAVRNVERVKERKRARRQFARR
jgi:hypothetical protein